MQRDVVVNFTGSVAVAVSVSDDAPDDTNLSDVLYAVQQLDVTDLNLAVTDYHFSEEHPS